MIFFFDRNIGTGLPRALLQLPSLPFDVTYHQLHFAPDAPDDAWLEAAGVNEWVVIGQDYKWHTLPHEAEALRQHRVGAIYLGDAEATAWETLRVFAHAYPRIAEAVRRSTPPFLFRVHRNGKVQEEII